MLPTVLRPYILLSCVGAALSSPCHEMWSPGPHWYLWAVLFYKLIIICISLSPCTNCSLISVFVSSVEVCLFPIFLFHKYSLLLMQDAYYCFMLEFLPLLFIFLTVWYSLIYYQQSPVLRYLCILDILKLVISYFLFQNSKKAIKSRSS